MSTDYIDAQREAFSKEGRATDHADVRREVDAPERIYVNKRAAAIPLIGIYTLTPHDDDVEYVKTEIATAIIAAQREVIKAQSMALGRILTMLKSSLIGHPVICADEGIAEAERALELTKGGTGD